jgi:PBP1b-binding outer membrane lipoprotein LpoB
VRRTFAAIGAALVLTACASGSGNRDTATVTTTVTTTDVATTQAGPTTLAGPAASIGTLAPTPTAPTRMSRFVLKFGGDPDLVQAAA